MQQRLETLQKVCALALAFSAAHIQRAALHSAMLRTAQRREQKNNVALTRESKPFAGEAERSGKRGYCAAFNGALPVQQRLETLQKVCALALHCAQRFTAATAYTARSIAQRPALHCTEHSEPRQGRSQQANQASCAKGVCCVFFVRLAPMKTAVGTPEL